MMMDVNQEYDSDRTETYTPPPLDRTDELNSSSSEKENQLAISYSIRKEQSIIVLDESFDPVKITGPMDSQSPILANNYWDQWPLVNNEINDEERAQLFSIPDIDLPPSPVQRTSPISSIVQSSNTIENEILDILTHSNRNNNNNNRPQTRKPAGKRKKKKKPMSEYRPPSPFSPKPDYKSMDIDKLRQHAVRYGLSNTLGKTRLVKILDEIYNVTHQYETDTDYEFDTDETEFAAEIVEKKVRSHTPPTPAIMPDTKKVKKRPALHQMSSSDDSEMHLPPSPPKVTFDNENRSQTSDDDDNDNDSNHEGRFLELTVHELSTSTASSSSLSILGTPPATQLNQLLLDEIRNSPMESSSQINTTKRTTPSDTESTSKKAKKAPKRPKLDTPTAPLKDLVRTYIESNPRLHAQILCYEPIDFEEFHKQMKTDLNIKIVSKELMQCLDDQCITFTLRSRKGAFTSVMRAKRRHK